MNVKLLILLLHVTGAAILLGSSVTAVYLAFTKKFTKDMGIVINYVKTLVPLAAIAQLVTGMYLFMMDRKEFESQGIFSVKLLLYIVSGILGSVIIGKKMKSFAGGKEEQGPTLKILLIIDLLILLAIVGIGVFLVEKPE